MSLAPAITGRVTTASNKLGTLENVKALALLGFRAQMIGKLTAASRPDIIDIQTQLGMNTPDKGGRQPRSVNTLLESTRKHIEASIFLRSYESTLDMYYGGGRGVLNTDALIVAFTHLKSLMPELEFLPDQAVMVAQMYHDKAVKMQRCKQAKCPAVFMVSTTEISIRQHVTTGECPMCREIFAAQHQRNVVRIPDSRLQRDLLSRMTD